MSGLDLASMTPDELVALREAIDVELISRDVCSHGIQVGEWCPQCKAECVAAITENELADAEIDP